MVNYQLINRDNDARGIKHVIHFCLAMTPQALMCVSLRSRPNVATKGHMANTQKMPGTLCSIGVLLAASGAYKSSFLIIWLIIHTHELLKDIVET